MASPLRSAARCRYYAELMRSLTDNMTDPGAKVMMLRNADDWDRMAEHADDYVRDAVGVPISDFVSGK